MFIAKRRNIKYVLIIVLVLILATILYSNLSSNKDFKGAIIKTNYGDIELELYPKKAPLTVLNFHKYAKNGFYKYTVFHRVIKDFMIQGGGYTKRLIKKQTNDSIELESTNKTGLSNQKYTISMARKQDPNSATSQFFINTKDNNFLDYQNSQNPGYAVFGKVIKGFDVVDTIENIETKKRNNHQNYPVKDVVIEDIVVK